MSTAPGHLPPDEDDDLFEDDDLGEDNEGDLIRFPDDDEDLEKGGGA